MKKLILLSVISASAAGLSAADKSYKLEDGKVLVNPYIIYQTPSGVDIAHRDGVMHFKMSELPAEIQKELGYDKEKAKVYDVSQIKAKQERVKQEEEKQKRQHDIVQRQQEQLAIKSLEAKQKEEEAAVKSVPFTSVQTSDPFDISSSSKANVFKKIRHHRKVSGKHRR